MLVKLVGLTGKHKLADKWESEPYKIIRKPDAGIPVYVVQHCDGSGAERTLHRNMLFPLALPLHRDGTQDDDGAVAVDDSLSTDSASVSEDVPRVRTRSQPELDESSSESDDKPDLSPRWLGASGRQGGPRWRSCWKWWFGCGTGHFFERSPGKWSCCHARRREVLRRGGKFIIGGGVSALKEEYEKSSASKTIPWWDVSAVPTDCHDGPMEGRIWCSVEQISRETPGYIPAFIKPDKWPLMDELSGTTIFVGRDVCYTLDVRVNSVAHRVPWWRIRLWPDKCVFYDMILHQAGMPVRGMFGYVWHDCRN